MKQYCLPDRGAIILSPIVASSQLIAQRFAETVRGQSDKLADGPQPNPGRDTKKAPRRPMATD